MARKFMKYPSEYVKADSEYDLDEASAVQIVCKDKQTYPRTLTAKVMQKLLTDPEVTTYKMFEELGAYYLDGDAQFRKGMDYACRILTWMSVDEIASEIMREASGDESPNSYGRFD